MKSVNIDLTKRLKRKTKRKSLLADIYTMLVDNKSSDFLKNILGGKILSDAENYFKKLNNAQRTEVSKLGWGWGE